MEAPIRYPSIQMVKIGGDTVEIEKLTTDLKAAEVADARSGLRAPSW